MLPKKFSDTVNSVIKQNTLLFQQGSKEARQYITELQKQVQQAIVGAKGFELQHLKEINSQLTKAGKELERKFTASLQANQEGAFSLGSNSALQGFKSVGINLALPKISSTLLKTAKDFSADLITNLSAQAIEKISGYVRRGVITGQNPYKTMEAINNNVFNEEGLFGRAEVIVRTENNRIFELANQERLDQIAKSVPGIKKVWVTAEDDRVRETHRKAGEDYAPGGAIGPIPVDEKFIVGGEEINFPADPDGDPHEVINCRCVSIPYIEDFEKETENV